MPQCCMEGCKNRAGLATNQYHGIKLHLLPNKKKFPRRYKKWLKFTGQPDKSGVNRFVCSHHFDVSDLEESELLRQTNDGSLPGPKLKKNAVPSIIVKDLADRCFVSNCSRRSVLHPFPHRFTSPERFRTWVDFCEQDAHPSVKSGICNRHFHSEDYMEDSTGKKFLLPGVLPSITQDEEEESDDEPWINNIHVERRKTLSKKAIISSHIKKMFYTSLNRNNKAIRQVGPDKQSDDNTAEQSQLQDENKYSQRNKNSPTISSTNEEPDVSKNIVSQASFKLKSLWKPVKSKDVNSTKVPIKEESVDQYDPFQANKKIIKEELKDSKTMASKGNLENKYSRTSGNYESSSKEPIKEEPVDEENCTFLGKDINEKLENMVKANLKRRAKTPGKHSSNKVRVKQEQKDEEQILKKVKLENVFIPIKCERISNGEGDVVSNDEYENHKESYRLRRDERTAKAFQQDHNEQGKPPIKQEPEEEFSLYSTIEIKEEFHV